MFRSILKIAAGTLVFAALHSALASRAAKRMITFALGERRRNGLYRPAYNVVAIASFGGLCWFASRLPDREFYRVRGPVAALMHSLQLLSLLYLLDGARQIGFLRFAGIPNMISLLRGVRTVPAEPEAQGPAMEGGRLRTEGPFRRSRHPLNFGMLPILWLMPRMTANLFAFNAVTTVYLIVGSMHEERRLEAAYADIYAAYRESGVNFFLPGRPIRTSIPGVKIEEPSTRQR